VVQVHPGPPLKSPVITGLFSLFFFLGIFLNKPFCQPFVNFTFRRMPVCSGLSSSAAIPNGRFRPSSLRNIGSLRRLRSIRSRMRRVRSMPTASIFPPAITGGSSRSLERSSSECFSCSEFHGPEYSGRGSGSQKCSKVLIQDGFAGGEIPSRFIL
jgi:hypothetical protein